MGSFGVSRHVQVLQKHVQGTTAATAAALATIISASEHDDTNADAKPNGPAVHEATDDYVPIDTDANDVAAADGGTVTVDDDADGTDTTNGTAKAATGGHTAYAAVGPASAAL